MSNLRTGRARFRAIAGSAAGAAALAVAILGGAGAANASTITTPSGPISVTNGQTITVSGTASSSANYVTLAVCNSTVGGLNGTHCDGNNFVAPIVPASNGTWSTTITVNRSFTNVNLSGGSSSGSTTCSSGGVQCQLQTSEYTSWPPTSAPVGVAGVNINF
jgi:hypothetical protein